MSPKEYGNLTASVACLVRGRPDRGDDLVRKTGATSGSVPAALEAGRVPPVDAQIQRQRLERLKRIPVARYQSAGPAFDLGDSPKSIQLRLKNPVWMLERRIESRQRHRSDAGEAHATLV
jgi:hypothetical protein